MKKKYLFILLFLVVLITFCAILQSTYAKYRKRVEQGVELTLARWNIKVNDESIAGKDSLAENIIPKFEGNEYVLDDVIAPGSTGYFDIVIDSSEVDVSFKYTVFVATDEAEKYPDITAYGYAVNPTDNGEITDYTDEGITGEIEHNTPLTTIRVYVKWNDDENNTMDNIQDTLLAIENQTLSMNTNIHFEQINN